MIAVDDPLFFGGDAKSDLVLRYMEDGNKEGNSFSWLCWAKIR